MVAEGPTLDPAAAGQALAEAGVALVEVVIAVDQGQERRRSAGDPGRQADETVERLLGPGVEQAGRTDRSHAGEVGDDGSRVGNRRAQRHRQSYCYRCPTRMAATGWGVRRSFGRVDALRQARKTMSGTKSQSSPARVEDSEDRSSVGDDRLSEVMDGLHLLEQRLGRPVWPRELADAVGWSSTHLVEAVLAEAVSLGCAVEEPTGAYRLG